MKEKTQHKRTTNEYRKKQRVFVWGFLALPIISWIVFYWYVNARSFIQAFQDPVTNVFSWINFEEIVKSFSSKGNDSLLVALENSLKYFSVETFVDYPIQIFFCYFLYKQIKGYKFFRYVFYLPAIIPGVAMTGLFKLIVSSTGPFVDLFGALGFSVPGQGFLSVPETATNAIIVYTIWLCPYAHMLLLCGAMNRIPIEVLEAARLDGITPWKELVNFILPLIWPTLSTLFLLTCTGILSSSGPILLLAPDSSTLRTTTLSYWIFDKTWANGIKSNGQYNLASAAGLIMTLISYPIIMFFRRLINKVPTVEY